MPSESGVNEEMGLSFLKIGSGYSLEIYSLGTEEGRIRQKEKLTYNALETENSSNLQETLELEWPFRICPN